MDSTLLSAPFPATLVDASAAKAINVDISTFCIDLFPNLLKSLAFQAA